MYTGHETRPTRRSSLTVSGVDALSRAPHEFPFSGKEQTVSLGDLPRSSAMLTFLILLIIVAFSSLNISPVLFGNSLLPFYLQRDPFHYFYRVL